MRWRKVFIFLANKLQGWAACFIIPTIRLYKSTVFIAPIIIWFIWGPISVAPRCSIRPEPGLTVSRVSPTSEPESVSTQSRYELMLLKRVDGDQICLGIDYYNLYLSEFFLPPHFHNQFLRHPKFSPQRRTCNISH